MVPHYSPRFGICPGLPKGNEFHVLVGGYLRGLLNLAAANAGSAHTDALGRTLHDGMHGLQVQIPAPLGDIVGMTDFIAKPGAAPANIAYFRHGDLLLWVEASVYQLGSGARNLHSPARLDLGEKP
jgi:hypothetical protein